MEAIKTIDLSKKYDTKLAVDKLNMTIIEDEVYALLGLNGAGKSTTIKMLTGLIKPTSGDAYVLGNSVVKNLDEVKEITSVSPQESALAKKLTVYENILMMAKIYGLDDKSAKCRTEQLINDFHLEEYKDKKAGVLSGGYQRRLSIAMAIVSKPKILFLDEPTLGLDVITRRALWKVVETLKKEMTIVLTTHYLEEAEALANHIGLISDGKLIMEGTLEEILSKSDSKNLEDAFVKICGGEE